jgi:hypothetical protein
MTTNHPAPVEPADDLIDYQDFTELCARHSIFCDDDESAETLHEMIQEAIAADRARRPALVEPVTPIDTLRNMPRNIRNTDAFGWQRADGPDGPWRYIAPPQSGAPWQTTSSTDPLHQANAEVSGVEALSSTAQAVMDAYQSASDGRYLNGEWIQDHAGQIAATICAVADQVVPAATPLDRATWSPFAGQIRAELLAIAAELEGQALRQLPTQSTTEP